MVKTEIISQMIDMKTSIASKASSISSWEWLGRGKYNISSELERYNNVTREDVMRVFNKYIKNRKAVINQIRPKSPFVEKLDSLISINPNANLILKEDLKFAKVEINTSTCLPYLGPECGVCISVCPVPGAITVNLTTPEIDQKICIGCAICREACMVSPSAINMLPNM